MTDIHVSLLGNLTRDPELRFTQGGTPVANFSIAHNKRYYDKTDNEWKDGPTSFFIDGRGIAEGHGYPSELTFNVYSSPHPPDNDVTFDYATKDDTATAPSDYIAESGTITIPATSSV